MFRTHAKRSIHDLHRAVESTLRYIQRHSELLTASLAGTGLALISPTSSAQSKASTGPEPGLRTQRTQEHAVIREQPTKIRLITDPAR